MAIKSLTRSTIENNIFYRSMLAGNSAYSPSAYDLLETITIDTNTASASFTGLGSYTDYQHLQLRANVRSLRSTLTDQLRVQLNGDSGSNYATVKIRGTGSACNVVQATARDHMSKISVPVVGDGNKYMAGIVIDFLDFASTNKYKMSRQFSGWKNEEVALEAGLWQNTNAITSIDLQLSNDDLAVDTSFSLYGIRGA